MELIGEHIVANSKTDLNVHTNNACHVVWTTNCLPQQEALRPMKELFYQL